MFPDKGFPSRSHGLGTPMASPHPNTHVDHCVGTATLMTIPPMGLSPRARHLRALRAHRRDPHGAPALGALDWYPVTPSTFLVGDLRPIRDSLNPNFSSVQLFPRHMVFMNGFFFNPNTQTPRRYLLLYIDFYNISIVIAFLSRFPSARNSGNILQFDIIISDPVLWTMHHRLTLRGFRGVRSGKRRHAVVARPPLPPPWS